MTQFKNASLDLCTWGSYQISAILFQKATGPLCFLPVVGVPVPYWISAVLPHTAVAMAREGSGSPEAMAVAPEHWIQRSLLVPQWAATQILRGEHREKAHRKDKQRLWGPSVGCTWWVDPSWVPGLKLLCDCPPQLRRGAKRKQKSHESRAGGNHLLMTVMGKRDCTGGN